MIFIECILCIGCDNQLFFIQIKCLNHQIKFFIWDTSTIIKIIIVFFCFKRKMMDIHTRVYHLCISRVVFFNSPSCIMRICYVYIRSLCSTKIPFSESVNQSWHNKTSQWVQYTKLHHIQVLVIVTPKIPGWCMTVAYMEGLWFCNDSF